ncbi:MAG: hypothetical protein POELPBGB_03129 [Bacteroidia bacterium]|nr:hypothetical protein [Bacteroidia bacterium]
MDKDKVPQDDENLLEGKFAVVKYALDKNGKYVKVQSVGWEPENVALKQAWEVINEKVEEARKRVLSGEVSPLAYWIEKNMMDEKLVGEYMGFSKWKVKEHLNPQTFSNLPQDLLKKYAEVFKITVEELVKIV